VAESWVRTRSFRTAAMRGVVRRRGWAEADMVSSAMAGMGREEGVVMVRPKRMGPKKKPS
jgi:hypothetical protein